MFKNYIRKIEVLDDFLLVGSVFDGTKKIGNKDDL